MTDRPEAPITTWRQLAVHVRRRLRRIHYMRRAKKLIEKMNLDRREAQKRRFS